MFKVKKDKKNALDVELSLKENPGDGGVSLMATTRGCYTWVIANITEEGISFLPGIPSGDGIPVDESGCIKLVQ